MSLDDRIDEAAVMAMRRSVDRCLASRNVGPLARSFATPVEFGAYWDEACEAFGDDTLMLHVVSELPLGTFGLVSYVIASAATLGDAFWLLGRDHSYRAAPGTFVETLRRGSSTVELHIRTDPVQSPIGEFATALFALRMRQLPITPVEPTAVGLMRPRPRDVAPWERFFGVVPSFGAANFIRFPASGLEVPLRTANQQIRKALRAIPDEPEGLVGKEVEGYLRRWIHQSPTEDHVAKTLGLSRRTLQRKLAGENLTFRGVLRAVRVAVAKELLAREAIGVSEVATAVGIEHPPSFTRLFREETGLSPEAWRRRALAQSAQ
jgi:AraC-like DNA-binding protein